MQSHLELLKELLYVWDQYPDQRDNGLDFIMKAYETSEKELGKYPLHYVLDDQHLTILRTFMKYVGQRTRDGFNSSIQDNIKFMTFLNQIKKHSSSS